MDVPRRKKCPTGAPAWLGTFADLMSLLMCFFVLLLSFSEMDVIKYKQVAGSMKDAFGIQRDLKVKELPKGVNIIAREFSPGIPTPTQLEVVQQQTADDKKMYLETGRNTKGEDKVSSADSQKIFRQVRQAVLSGKVNIETDQQLKESYATLAKAEAEEKLDLNDEQQKGAYETLRKALAEAGVEIATDDEKRAHEALKAAAEAKKLLKTQADADRIRSALAREISEGAVDVETEGLNILIRIREKASFASGRADLNIDFVPLLSQVGTILNDTEGEIIVAGHTDDVPISTGRFRSNWELSASRAVTIVHALIENSPLPQHRFLIEGYADTMPVVDNSTVENRAQNRRVEIIVKQGADLEVVDNEGDGAIAAPAPAAETGAAPSAEE